MNIKVVFVGGTTLDFTEVDTWDIEDGFLFLYDERNKLIAGIPTENIDYFYNTEFIRHNVFTET